MQIADSDKRATVLDPEKSFIVQSPAGSGKTELLIQRFLTLLAVVPQPEAVLAITFTRKAAGEMRRRIMTALQRSTGPRPEKEHEALTWDRACRVRVRSEGLGWRLMDNPGRLRIQTIDSLCASLTRQMPWLSRLGGPPNIVEHAEELYIEAARSTIALLEDEVWTATVSALLLHVDNNFKVLEGLISSMLTRRDQWLRHIEAASDPVQSRAALEFALKNVILDAVRKADAAIPPEVREEIVFLTAAAGRNLLDENLGGPATSCAGLKQIPHPDQLDAWLGIADMLLTKEGTWRKSLTVRNGFPKTQKALKQRCVKLISSLADSDLLRLSLHELRYLPGSQFEESQWRILSALVKLLPVAVEQLKNRFRERGVADYLEVAMAARRSLGEPGNRTDPAAGLDYRIQHILIDEYQDTSVSQYSLVEALTAGWEPGDGRTIFAVGDPMQSIYRFREAEVGLFLKTCREKIGGVPLELIRLSSNFRSDKRIVDWVNASFPRILPPEEDITTGAIPFCASDSVHAAALDPAVTIHPFFDQDDQAEAERIVETIRSARERNLGKVAILARARGHLVHILPALQRAGLKFRAVEIEALAEVPLIRDLTALTRSLLHFADRIAWLAILRAPWCGMTLADLHALAGGPLNSTVWDLMRDESRVQQLDPDGRRRLMRVRSVLESAFDRKPASLRSWVEGVWLALGGPACTATATDLENAEAFFNLIEELDEGGTLDLDALQDRIEELYANPDSEADESLQIMSIHKAKGLEFDVVIVPGLGRKIKSDESQLMLWLERPRLGGEPDLLLAPIQAIGADRDKTYDYLKRVDRFKSEHESGRLLYVAATRAKSALHLLGHTGCGIKNGAPELKEPAAGSLLQRMWEVAEPVFQEALMNRQPAAEGEALQLDRTPQVIQRLPLEWELPVLPSNVSGVPVQAPIDTEEKPVSFHWVGDTLRHTGTVVHQMLRHIADNGLSKWDETRLKQHRPIYLSALASLGVSAAELPEAADRIEAALGYAISDERGKWLLGAHTDAACEYSLSGILEGHVVSARVDRTFIDDEGTRWVVDYKSSSHEGAGLDAFLDNEQERYREQLVRYRLLFGLMEDRPVRTALYFPLLNAWREVN